MSVSYQPVRQQTGAQDKAPVHSSPNADPEAELIPTFADNMKIISCPVVTAVDVLKTCYVSPENIT
jgi:hypothetical protein